MTLEKANWSVLFRAYLFLTIAAFLITIFLASIIQGVLVQIKGDFGFAVGLYLAAWFCLGAGAILFFKGRTIVKYALLEQ